MLTGNVANFEAVLAVALKIAVSKDMQLCYWYRVIKKSLCT
jgi:hypothetical protein